MKKQSILFLVMVFMAGMAVQAQEQLDKRLVVPLSKPGERGSLSIELLNGGITVTSYSGSEIIIEAGEREGDDLVRVPAAVGRTYVVAGRDAERDIARERAAAERAERGAYFFAPEGEEKDDNINRSTEGMKKIGAATFQLNAEEKDNHVVVESESWQKTIQLNVKVPRNFDLKLSTVNRGNIEVTDIDGQLEIENINGYITASGVTGTAIMNTVNGGTKIEFNKIDPDSPMSFSTMNGDIELILPASVKADFKMKTDMGEIFTDFDMNIRQQEPQVKKDNSSGKYKVSLTKWVFGEINGGGPEITMQSMHGDFYIRKK
jgi:hypothetical protein